MEGKRARLSYIDAVKAIAMISIVMFHACTNHPNTYLATNAYLIRLTSAYGLPVFFFINGFLYRNKDIEHPVKEILGRIKSYYLPFVCYNLFYLAMHNIFVSLHMLDEQYGNGYYSAKEYLIHFVKAILGHREFFSGALWFLGSILIMNTILIVCEFLIHRCFSDNWRLPLLGAIVFLCMVAGNSGVVTDRMKLSTSLSNLGYFYFGVLYRHFDWNCIFEKRRTWYIIAGIILDLMISFNKLYNPLGCSSHYVFILLDYLNAVFCIVAIMMICRLPVVSNSKVLKMVGQNTMDIMGLHFMVFKLVSWFIILVKGFPITRLPEYPVLVGVGGAWWLLYTVVGVALPTAFSIWRQRGGRKERKV